MKNPRPAWAMDSFAVHLSTRLEAEAGGSGSQRSGGVQSLDDLFQTYVVLLSPVSLITVTVRALHYPIRESLYPEPAQAKLLA
eukprot:gene7732-904_t